MAIRYVPTPVPQDDNQVLRQWLDENNRRIEASQEEELLRGEGLVFGAADNVVCNDLTTTPILNYAESFAAGVIGADPVAGSVTLPNQPGLVEILAWLSLEQVTVTRNFTIQLRLEVNGTFLPQIIASGYIPQVGTSVRLGLSAIITRSVVGSEVFRLGLILDGASPATFAIDDSSFEVSYLTARG